MAASLCILKDLLSLAFIFTFPLPPNLLQIFLYDTRAIQICLDCDGIIIDCNSTVTVQDGTITVYKNFHFLQRSQLNGVYKVLIVRYVC